MAEKYEEAQTPTVVPASFSPAPEQFEIPVTQELRSKQSRWAQGYLTQKIGYLEIQYKTPFYKRAIYTMEHGYNAASSDAQLLDDIAIAKTAKTVMMDHISEWAGNHEEKQFHDVVLPAVWNRYVTEIKGPPAPEAEDAEVAVEAAEDESLAPEEMEPVVVVNRPEVSINAPKSEVVPPDQLSLGDVLGKIAENNKD